MYPLSELEENKLNLYSLQTVIYAFMIESFGYICNDIQIEWINVKTGEIEFYDIDYKEVLPYVIRLLEWFVEVKDDLDDNAKLPKNYNRQQLNFG